MNDRLLLLHGLEDARSVLVTLASEAGYRTVTDGFLADVLQAFHRGGMAAMCVEPAENKGSLDHIIRSLREMPETLRPYLIVLDEGADEAAIGRHLRTGADDVIIGAPGTEKFELHLRSAGRFLRLQRAFCLHALHDPLTGVLNRGTVMTMLDRELQRARRFGYHIAVVMADFDKLKVINDSHGHLTGDAAMCAAASRIQSQLRPYDAVGRYGGDEFILVLSNCTHAQATDICQRIHHAVVSAPVRTPQATLDISISMGVWITDPRTPTTPPEAIAHADAALYEAKASPKSRVIVRQ